MQHARLLCLSLSPRVCSNSCPLCQWCYLTIWSSATPFSCPQSFPSNLSQLTFPISQLFVSGGQSIGASALASVLSMDIQGWFPGLISLLSQRLSRVFSSTTVWKHQFFGTQPSLWSNPHIHTWLLEKAIALIIWTFVGRIMSLLFNMLSRFVIAFLPLTKCYLIFFQGAHVI